MEANNKRGEWGSKFGFLMAAVGSAIGLGNLWGFPYKMGKGGGFAFLVLYLVFCLTVGYVVMVSEMAIGRKGKMDAVGSYKKLDPKTGFVGAFGVLSAFIILCFYCVLGGWVLKYAFTYLLDIFGTGFGGVGGAEYFTAFISKPVEPIVWFALFLGLTALVVQLGVEKGIEQTSKFMMPALFVMLLIIIIRSVTLPGAGAGLAFMFKPDFSVFSSLESTINVAAIALSQMFFSLSLGMGIIVTYGSYLGKDQGIESSSIIVPLLDTLAATMAGLAILPAVFAFNLDPSAGPGLMFITLKEVFTAMPLGSVFGLMFFVLVFFAALTSSISLLEVVCAYLIDSKGLPRKKTTLVASLAIFVLGIPVAMSFGVFAHIKPILGMDILDSLDFISEYTLMPLGATMMCLLIGWKWKPDVIVAEVKEQGMPFKYEAYYRFMIKWVTPILVAFVLYKSSIEVIIKHLLG